jgi:hypothetical protein
MPSKGPASLNGRYTLECTLTGHRGAILCLAATDDGSILASRGAYELYEPSHVGQHITGTDGVRLWNLDTKEAIQAPAGVGTRAATTSAIWIRREDEPEEVLFYGTQNGYLTCWRQMQRSISTFEEVRCIQLAHPGEISGLAFEGASNRLAVINRNSLVQLLMVDSLMELRPIFSVTIDDCLPKAIAFGHTNGESQRILVFSMHDGRMYVFLYLLTLGETDYGRYTLRGSDGKVEYSRNTGGMMCASCLSQSFPANTTAQWRRNRQCEKGSLLCGQLRRRRRAI